MKNRLPFASMTFSFTIAGSSIGYALHDNFGVIPLTMLIALIGAFSAAWSGDQL